jgi:hypothetical protein
VPISLGNTNRRRKLPELPTEQQRHIAHPAKGQPYGCSCRRNFLERTQVENTRLNVNYILLTEH